MTSSGRRRIRPSKFNDFADMKPKSTSNENLVLRHSQQELETPVKESRRRRSDREVIEMGSPAKDFGETKRTRYHTSATKLETEEHRTSKRKISLNTEEIEVTATAHKRQRTMRDSSGATTPTRHTRGRSSTSGVSVKEDTSVIEPEKTHKRRRTTGLQSIDDSNPLETDIRIKEEPRTSQSEVTRYGKLSTPSTEKQSLRESRLIAQPVIKSEQIEAPRRGRKPKQPKQPVIESDSQSELTDAGRKFPSSRLQRMNNRKEVNHPTVERRSSRNISAQEQSNSPVASSEPSGDEFLSDKRSGRRHSRRSRGQSIQEPEIMQPPMVENQSEDDIDSIVEDEPISSRKSKTVLADIFTKAAGKRGKRKRSSPIMLSKIHGHRTSGRIAAAAAMAKRQQSPSSERSAGASTPHHSHGGTSSDDQQFSNKKQMTLPEMMQMQKAKNTTAEQRFVFNFEFCSNGIFTFISFLSQTDQTDDIFIFCRCDERNDE